MRLKTDYTFENFIVGPSNRLSFSAAKAVCEHPKVKYNPFFICGTKGNGKTHLLKAMEVELKTSKPNLEVKYVDLQFFNELFSHTVDDELLKIFREQMRIGDVFLFDNLDYLQKNEASREEFFHTFNDIFQNENQIVITSELNTKELESFPERLVSRLEWGLTTTLSNPIFETRLTYYEKNIEKTKIKFEKHAIEELANKEEKSFARLKFSTNNFLNFIQKQNIELISTTLVKDYLSIQNKEKIYEPQEIQLAVARYLNVKPIDLISASRIANIVEARHIAIYLIRKLTNYTLKETGILFGKRHHTTIMYAEEEIKNKIENDKDFSFLINKIIEQII